MHVYLIILTDNEGGVAVEVFDSFEHAKAHVLEGIMSDSSYRHERKEVTGWVESALPCQVADSDGVIRLEKARVRD